MYASLDRADMAVEEDGRRLAIQTEHRSAAEIDEDYDLSVIFALTRCLNPLRSDQFDGVRFAFLEQPHDGLVALLTAAGAEIEHFGGNVSNLEPSGEAQLDVVDEAVRGALERVGRATLARYQVRPDVSGLKQLQTLMYAQVAVMGGPEDDEIGWWTSVVELGAATGEVIKSMHQGNWVRDDQQMTTVPFVFGRGSSVTNVFDKVERFFERGESEAPTILLDILKDDGAEAGATMYNLRPAGWGGQQFGWCRPLLGNLEALDDVPLVALVHDLPNTTRSIARDTDPDELETLEAAAQANLAALEVEVQEVDAAGLKMLATHGSYYASEKILDADHLRTLQERLGAKILLACIPRKGVLFTMSGLVSSEASAVMLAVAEGQYAEAPPNEQLTARVFLIDDGIVVGTVEVNEPQDPPVSDEVIPTAAVDESDPNPPQTSFFARLFGADS